MLRRSAPALVLAAMIAVALAAPALSSLARVAEPCQDCALKDVTLTDVALINALTFGVDGTTLAALQARGREAWLQAQLHPPAGDRLPEAAQRQLDALPGRQKSAFDLATAFAAQGRAAGEMADPEQKAAARKAVQEGMSDVARQAATAFILRALYSPDQLRERLTWFWLNHFNVHQAKANLRLLIGDYTERAIRPHALGRFRDLLMATLRHPAMLRYLDNAENAAGRLNENYAREIMELHTMGVGSGYAQKDVEELARILTGVGIDQKQENPKLKPELQPLLVRDGLFEFNPARHDFGDKVLLGHAIKGRGFCRGRGGRRHSMQRAGDRAARRSPARHLFRRRHAVAHAGSSGWRSASARPTATSRPCSTQ